MTVEVATPPLGALRQERSNRCWRSSVTTYACARCVRPPHAVFPLSNDAISVAHGEVRDRGLWLYLRADRRVT